MQRSKLISGGFSLLALSACGGSAVLLQSADAGPDDARATPDATFPDAAQPDGSIANDADANHDGTPGSDGSDGSDDAAPPVACGELPERALTSVDDVKSILQGAPIAPFTGGWEPCASAIALCPSGAPELTFDPAGTALSCGLLFESGFHVRATFPMTIVDTGQADGSNAHEFELHVESDAGPLVYPLRAQGPAGWRVGIWLLDPATHTWVTFEPIIPLP